jgi:hypothetical protein
VNCKYFHPPAHLRHLVVNAGKNNLRLRNEIQTNIRRQEQQQQLQQQQVMLQAYPTAQGYVCQALPCENSRDDVHLGCNYNNLQLFI